MCKCACACAFESLQVCCLQCLLDKNKRNAKRVVNECMTSYAPAVDPEYKKLIKLTNETILLLHQKVVKKKKNLKCGGE